MTRQHCAVLLLILAAPCAEAATVWDGPAVEFEKTGNSDPALPENQDILTATVAITRGTSGGGIYNALQESGFNQGGNSPAGTLGAFAGAAGNPSGAAFGAAACAASSPSPCAFSNWFTAQGGAGSQGLNLFRPAVMWLVDEDVFIDVQFTLWGDPADAEFGYIRGGPPVTQTPIAMPLPAPLLAATAPLLALSARFARGKRRG